MSDNQDIDVDSLLSEIDAPSEIPMHSSEEPAAAPEAPSWDPSPFEFDWKGQKVRPDSLDKAKTWMQQGYNYSERAAELNRRQAEFDARFKDWEGKAKHYSRYDEVDKYVKENPQWWEFVEQQWQQRGQQGQPQLDPNLEPIIKPLQEKLSQYDTFFQQLQQERQQEVIAKEDQALDAEISEIRKAHPNIDLNAVDESGKTLEQRILNHAMENGINTFRAAFRDYLHDQLVQTAKADSLQKEAKSTQIATKQGLLGKTPTPRKGIERAQNVRGKSYDALTQEALAELGVG